MECPTISIDSWQGFADFVARLQDRRSVLALEHLFRGHADARWPLQSSLARHLGRVPASDAIEAEIRLLRAFQAQAHVHLPGRMLPEERDVFAWWALMQHHGVPTRLIDWSASAYVALYFAVASHWGAPGVIWAVNAGTLMRDTRTPDFRDPKFEACIGDPVCEATMIASPAAMQSERMIAQQGHFTFCTNVSGDQAALIAAICGHPKHKPGEKLVRVLIPATAKPSFLRQLRAMNVTASSLFPGIDGLGRSLREAMLLDGDHRCNAEPDRAADAATVSSGRATTITPEVNNPERS